MDFIIAKFISLVSQLVDTILIRNNCNSLHDRNKLIKNTFLTTKVHKWNLPP